MALSFSRPAGGARPSKSGEGGLRVNAVDITFDASYVTGGWAIAPSTLGYSIISAMVFSGMPGANTFAVFDWDATNNKLRAGKSNTAALFQEIAAGDLNGRVGRFIVLGS